jgi:hypothetical protein
VDVSDESEEEDAVSHDSADEESGEDDGGQDVSKRRATKRTRPAGAADDLLDKAKNAADDEMATARLPARQVLFHKHFAKALHSIARLNDRPKTILSLAWTSRQKRQQPLSGSSCMTVASMQTRVSGVNVVLSSCSLARVIA